MTARSIVEAMRVQDRRRFLPPDVADEHHRDVPLPIGFGQTNSQPSTVAAMMALLEPFPGMRVLDVGSGSGWTSAILGELGGPGSQVWAVELVPELVERSRLAVSQPWVSIHPAEAGVFGLPGHGPYDRILVSAMGETLPAELVDQLAPGGVMVAPWRDVMHRVRKTGMRSRSPSTAATASSPCATPDSDLRNRAIILDGSFAPSIQERQCPSSSMRISSRSVRTPPSTAS